MSKKVLIVDDSSTVRQQVASALAPTGLEVLEAENGIDGLAKLEANDDIALVFCDVNMPRMNGLEMIALLRRMQKHAELPVVMLTTESQAELMQEAKASGAKAWIIKPFKPELLASIVRKVTLPAGS